MMWPALLAVALLSASAASDDSYTTKYDNINLDEIIQNERLYQKYFECLTGTGVCTAEGKELKDIIPDALATKCSKCNDVQKAGVEKVMKYLIEEKPEDFAALEKIYDPDGKYKEEYAGEAEKRGIKLN